MDGFTKHLGRLMPKFRKTDRRKQSAFAATLPADRAATHQIGYQFLIAAAVAALIALVDPDAVEDPRGLYAIAAAAFCFGVYLRFSLDAGTKAINRSITGLIFLVTLIVMAARPMELTPLLYLWPLVLSAHFSTTRRLVFNMVFALGTFAWALSTSAVTQTPIASFVIFGLVATATVAAYRYNRTKVARLFGELDELTSRDSLTGALNREAFQAAFSAWIDNGMRRHVESSLLLLDIDGFQRINDAHGHEAGDEALKHLTQIVYECIRETDAFGRVQGEEFALLFPATSPTDALSAAERIRAAIELRSSEGATDGFTVSIGVTGGNAFSDPWKAAERGLSLAKAAGRNRVVLAETETEAEAELAEARGLHAVPRAA